MEQKNARMSLQTLDESSYDEELGKMHHREKSESSPPTEEVYEQKPLYHTKTGLVSTLIILVGIVACGIIVGFGVTSAKEDDRRRFGEVAGDLLQQFEKALDAYVITGLWIHRETFSRTISRRDFRVVYDYVLSSDVEVKAIGIAYNISTEEERQTLENETLSFFQEELPQGSYYYRGITALVVDETTGERGVRRQPTQPFYFPMHLAEPIEDVHTQHALIDFDLYSSPLMRAAIDNALASWDPALTERLEFSYRSAESNAAHYSVMLVHPGKLLPDFPEIGPRDLSIMMIDVPSILSRAHWYFTREKDLSVYVFDSTESSKEPVFLGGAKLNGDDDTSLEFKPETTFSELHSRPHKYLHQKEISLATRTWKFCVVSTADSSFTSYGDKLSYLLLCSSMILVACCSLALWIYTNSRRALKINQLRSDAAKDRATMMVESATKTAMKERELNDFIAHEVRNPLSAAISACSFVSSAVNETRPLIDQESQQSVREDVGIIDSSLQFINDLLRNMLDMHRANSNQLQVDLSPTDVLRDILEPVSSMLYRRGCSFELLLDCPEHLVVKTDKLRLKQIVLNLGRNAVKFVSRGFIRLRAEVVNGSVVLYIEDSGPGIPEEKRGKLFAKFQESLDSLNQGTGVGLCLCKSLSELLGGHLWLDETYDSGVEGRPGARFVLDLKMPPMEYDVALDSSTTEESDTSAEYIVPEEKKEDAIVSTALDLKAAPTETLPQHRSVLFVDDDLILRRLFVRSLKRILPDWTVSEAASGETALRLVESQSFDLIFLDQYMASVDKQLLGTETARALRSKGVQSTICGLSANDLEDTFLSAGADAFMMKPFPCKKEELELELCRVVSCGRANGRQQVSGVR